MAGVLEPRNEVRGSRELTEGAFLLYSFCLVSFFGGVNSFHRKRSPSLSDGGLVPLIFLYQINFLLIGKTSFEPRDYRVIFVIQNFCPAIL